MQGWQILLNFAVPILGQGAWPVDIEASAMLVVFRRFLKEYHTRLRQFCLEICHTLSAVHSPQDQGSTAPKEGEESPCASTCTASFFWEASQNVGAKNALT